MRNRRSRFDDVVRAARQFCAEPLLDQQTAALRIRSATVLARAAGLPPDRVCDWLLGRALPTEGESDALASFVGVPGQEVEALRLPARRLRRRA